MSRFYQKYSEPSHSCADIDSIKDQLEIIRSINDSLRNWGSELEGLLVDAENWITSLEGKIVELNEKIAELEG